MSETTTETTLVPEQEAQHAPPQQEADVQTAAETQAEPVETEVKADPAPRPRTDRHIAHLTARASAAEEARARAEAERDAALALIQSGRDQGDDQPARPGLTAADVRAEATRMVAEERAEFARVAVISRGIKELGADVWNEKTGMLHSLGATANPVFMAAILDMDNAPKLVKMLADDPDLLSEILAKPPAALAAHLGRMDAKLGAPAAAARVSQAPTPPRKVAATAVVPEIDLADPKLSMKEWADAWEKTMPPHLGGRRRAS